MNKYDDFISGERFQALADVIVGPGNTVSEKLGTPRGNKYPIFYAHTHNAMQVMQYAHKFMEPCVVITHNSDGKVKVGKDTGLNDIHANDCPENVVRWYAQNVDAKYDIPSYITPIPIGLENKYCFPYDKARMLFDRDHFTRPEKGYYLNFNPHTNYPERYACYKTFEKVKNELGIEVTLDLHQNGDDYHHYLNEIMKHRVIVSPEGNGLDCHRTWEALYMGRCVLTRSNESMRYFAKLEQKIFLIDEWANLTQELLIDLTLRGYFDAKTTKMLGNAPDILSLEYWKKRIYNGT